MKTKSFKKVFAMFMSILMIASSAFSPTFVSAVTDEEEPSEVITEESSEDSSEVSEESATEEPEEVFEAPEETEEVLDEIEEPSAEPIEELEAEPVEESEEEREEIPDADLVPEEDTILIPESEGETLLMTKSLMPETRSLSQNLMRAPPIQQEPVTADHITIEKVTMRWLSCSTGSEEPAKYDDLILKPTNDIVPNQQWQLDVAFSGKDDIKAGDLEIVIPAYIWFDRDGNEPGVVTLAVPREGESGNNDFAWKRVGDTLVITNTKDLSAASKYMIQGTFRMTSPDPNSDPVNFTSTYAHQMVDGINGITDYMSNDLFGVINVTTPNTGEHISMTSNSINAVLDTFVEVSGASKTAYDKYKKAYTIFYDYNNADIPEELLPESPEDYLYIKWYVDGRATGNQPFTMTVTDTVQDKIYKVEGTSEIEIEVDGVMLGASACVEGTVKSQDGKTVTATLFEGYTEDDKSCYIWTAYKKSYFEGLDATFKVYNDQEVTVKGIDDQVVTKKSASASVAVRLPIVWTIKKEWIYNEDKYDTPLEVIKSRQPETLKVWLDNKSTGKKYVFQDTLSDENNWMTQYEDDGTVSNYDAYEHSYEVTRRMHGENGVSLDIVSGRDETVYTASGRWYYKYWGYDHKSTKYDEETHTWTFVNDYHEGIKGGYYDIFEVEKHATNHKNSEQKATSDKDLNLLRDDKQSTTINYNVHTGTICLGHTSEPGAKSWEVSKHGKRYVTLDLHDYGEYFESRHLRNDEFRISEVTMMLPQIYKWVPEKEGSEEGAWERTDNVPVNLYGRDKETDEWTLYAVMDENGVVAVQNGATLNENNAKKVMLPENIHEVKETIRTNGGRAYLDYNVGIILFPSQDIKDKIVDYTERLAKALHVLGMINIQFIAMDGEVYVIEVNPRSSRTVPYISKVTGIPIVDLAAKAILGHKITDMGYKPGLQPEADYIAIKMPVFSFEKLRGAEISLGPEMKSTGECLGIAKTFEEALYKAFLGAGVVLPKHKQMIITVKDKDKPEALEVAKRFEKLGYTIYATRSTAKFLQDGGVDARWVNKITQESPNVMDLILGHKIDLVIDTPTQGHGDKTRDGFLIRRNAIETGINCITAMDTAVALATSLESATTEYTLVDVAKI